VKKSVIAEATERLQDYAAALARAYSREELARAIRIAFSRGNGYDSGYEITDDEINDIVEGLR